ncbi:MAG: YkvA family protein [Aquificaceae bacterium]|nr:YkvA family protein [Aquificaceae bacterium]MCX8164329.1 YkvA family protein [Aquificaceae bacterium]
MEEKLKKYRRDASLKELGKLLEEKLRCVPPTMEYVRNLILDVKMFFRLLSDEEFDLSPQAREDFTSALVYFIEDKDSIPDRIPLIGYWDDYRLVKYVKTKHKEEIERYFSQVKHFIANYF